MPVFSFRWYNPVMNKTINVPFIKSRGFECGQTCAAMMIKYYFPNFEPDFDKINKIIHHTQNKYTFPVQNAIILDHYGIEAKSSSTDLFETTKENPNIFREWFGNEYKNQIKNVDIDSFNWMVKEGRRKKLIERKKTSLDDIIELFQKGCLVSLCIDSKTLHKKTGKFNGHFVILTGIKDNTILIHDPDDKAFVPYPKETIKKAYNHPIISDDLFIAYRKK